MTNPSEIREKILKLTREYSKEVHAQYRPSNDIHRKKWEEGDEIPYAGRVFTEDEVEAAVASSLDFWLTHGKECSNFENEFASFLGVKYTLLVNSGSSANLIAISTLTSYSLPKKKRICPGDEVITVAAGFPTTVSPIVQVGAVPVFIDADPITGNACCEQLEQAYQHGKTKAVMMAHALGNPFNLAATLEFCRKYDLWLIEDNCDSLGSSYSMPRRLAEKYGFYENSPGLYEGEDQIVRWTGTWGDISTQSFYPPHHLTMGEGGAVNISTDKKLKTISLSMRDWGRDCWCPSGIDDTCNKRYSWKLGDLPEGYDHKYTYSHLGYNLKGLEAQAAIGRVQLKRLPEFIKARKNNWLALRTGLEHHEDVLEFALPTHAKSWSRKEGFEWSAGGCKSDCSWFGFKISLKQDSKIPRSRLVRYLESARVGNRMLFGGNLIRQPAFSQLMQDRPNAIRIAASLEGSDNIMRNTLFLGTYPGLTADMINQEITLIDKFIKLEKDRI